MMNMKRGDRFVVVERYPFGRKALKTRKGKEIGVGETILIDQDVFLSRYSESFPKKPQRARIYNGILALGKFFVPVVIQRETSAGVYVKLSEDAVSVFGKNLFHLIGKKEFYVGYYRGSGIRAFDGSKVLVVDTGEKYQEETEREGVFRETPIPPNNLWVLPDEWWTYWKKNYHGVIRSIQDEQEFDDEIVLKFLDTRIKKAYSNRQVNGYNPPKDRSWKCKSKKRKAWM